MVADPEAFNRDRALELDVADPLAAFRDRMVVTDSDLIYADGNSLGRLPKASAVRATELVEHEWGDRLIRGWGEGWLEGPERVGARIAEVIGAGADEVIVADSTTINFFKLSVAALRYQQGRGAVVTDTMNFPSDLHSLSESIELLGGRHTLDLVASDDGIHGPTEQIIDRLDHNTALLTLSHVAFKSGYLYDMERLCAAAREAGALTLWDLSHSVGSVPIDLTASAADLAVGCTYKYLNGGPGAPAFLYIRRELQSMLRNPVAGWMGRRDLFDFDLDYEPDPTLRSFLTGTPSVLSMSLIEPGVDLILEAGMDRLRAKSIALCDFLHGLWELHLEPLGYTFNSPTDAGVRGSHLSLGHADGLSIDLALINDANVIPDFRAPDNIRIGLAPLYTGFVDVYELAMRLKRVVDDGLHEHYRDRAPTVT